MSVTIVTMLQRAASVPPEDVGVLCQIVRLIKNQDVTVTVDTSLTGSAPRLTREPDGSVGTIRVPEHENQDLIYSLVHELGHVLQDINDWPDALLRTCLEDYDESDWPVRLAYEDQAWDLGMAEVSQIQGFNVAACEARRELAMQAYRDAASRTSA